MSMRASRASGALAWPLQARTVVIWALVVAGLVLVAVLGQRPGQQGLPLDPNSPAPDGTKALVEVLRALGARVTVSPAPRAPGSAAGAYATALLLSDNLDDQARARLLGWVRQGGTLVVADPDSPVTSVRQTGSAMVGLLGVKLDRDCDLPALRDVAQAAPWQAVFFKVPAGAQGCFPGPASLGGARGAWLLVQPLGAGVVVRLGGPDALVNAHLGEADNGLLAASLLAPLEGTTVTVLQPPLPGGGRRGLTDLVAPRVKLALWQLVVAFALLVAWRARRLGRPVSEPQPVRLDGSELVVAVGNLLQRAGGRQQAANLLAADLRRALCERLGLPPTIPPEQLAATAAARTGMLPERVLAAVAPAPPHDEAELVALGQTVDQIRQGAWGARARGPGHSTRQPEAAGR